MREWRYMLTDKEKREQRNKDIIKRYENYESQVDIANVYKISHQRVQQILKKYGYKPRDTINNTTAKYVPEVIEMVEQRKTVSEITETTGLGYWAIKNVKKKYNAEKPEISEELFVCKKCGGTKLYFTGGKHRCAKCQLQNNRAWRNRKEIKS